MAPATPSSTPFGPPDLMTTPERQGSIEQLWFPGRAPELTTLFENQYRYHRGLISRYGTHRWITSDPSAPRFDAGTFQLGRYQVPVELLPPPTAALFVPLTMAVVDAPTSLSALQEACEVLARIDGLDETVGQLVRAVHLLEAPPSHDVSHSSPELPFSIFVSVPGPGDKNRTLRLAESILHESMHLQLTLIDRFDPIISERPSSEYSPWKKEIRPVSGLLHGLYVFAVIFQVLDSIQNSKPMWSPYCRQRRITIAEEVATLPDTPGGLSRSGTDLWQQCRRAVLGAS